VHLIGPDGHSPRTRPPPLAAAHRRSAGWAGSAAADLVCGSNGAVVLSGRAPWLPEPEPERRRLSWLW
jgi:hypothetical protein